jgi:predicted amidohydrolase YtcJ
MLSLRNAPDLLLYNGRIATQLAEVPYVSALAVRADRVLAIGDDAEILALADQQTLTIDLGGRTVIPGINDAHNHMLDYGLKLKRISLDDCDSIAEMTRRVAVTAATLPDGSWIVGDGWNESLFAEGRLPNRHDLDAATTRHPVLLRRFFNTDVVNSLALELAGITAETADPQGGRIERFADGSASGILRASAKDLCRTLIPAPNAEECAAALAAAAEAYARVGITSILDPGLNEWEIQAYINARQAGVLLQRANLMVSWHGFRTDEPEALCDQRSALLGGLCGMGDDRLRIGGLKMAIDGGTTSRSAWMYQPFLGEDTVYDYNRLDPAQLREYFARGHDQGWDIGIHAIGDRAHHEAAAAFHDVLQQRPAAGRRHNLIHGYFASPQSLDWMVEHELAVVVQPTFIWYEGDDLFRDVGAEPAARYKPLKTYLARGIHVVATSDVPSTPYYDPFIGLYSMVTRKSRLGTLIAPDEAITREQALEAYTLGGAWLTHEEQDKGRLAPGCLADFAVLDRDYFSCDAEEIKDIRVLLTAVGGQIIHRTAELG